MVLDDIMAERQVVARRIAEERLRNRHMLQRRSYEESRRQHDNFITNMHTLHAVSQELPGRFARVEAQFRDLHYNRWGFIHSPNVHFPWDRLDGGFITPQLHADEEYWRELMEDTTRFLAGINQGAFDARMSLTDVQFPILR